MVTLAFWILIFIVSLALLIKGSNYFIDSAEKIGIFFKIPSFIIGVSIVAFGTSLPELISSIFAVLKNSSEIVVGNVIGSNITNIFLILGLTAIIGKDIKLSYNIAYVDLPLLAGSALLFTFLIWDRNFVLYEALFLIAGIIVYILYAVNNRKDNDESDKKSEVTSGLVTKKLESKTWLTLFISLAVIYLGARYTVDSIIKIAEMANIGKEIIAASAVALGTSLPELVVSVVAIRKGESSIAVGNILGSNIFNTFAVMGIPALFGTLYLPKTIIELGLPIMLAATFLFFLITQQKRITQWEGWMLLIFYLFFLGKIFNFL
jgi:cation:H+ antiporter